MSAIGKSGLRSDIRPYQLMPAKRSLTATFGIRSASVTSYIFWCVQDWTEARYAAKRIHRRSVHVCLVGLAIAGACASVSDAPHAHRHPDLQHPGARSEHANASGRLSPA